MYASTPSNVSVSSAVADSNSFSFRKYPQFSKIVIASLTAMGLLIVFLVSIYWEDPAPNLEIKANTPPVDFNAQNISRIKGLWNTGAEFKRSKQYAEAATSWQKILELKPGHPGIQAAIDKLPVEITYMVEAPVEATSPVNCNIAFLDHRQRRVKLKNVRLPWKISFLSKRGQAVSVVAKTNDNYPIVTSITVGRSAFHAASTFTAWWLDYRAEIGCITKAAHGNSFQVTTKGEVWKPESINPQNDAINFMKRIRAALGDDTELLLSNVLVVDNTDILMIIVSDRWGEITNDGRIGIAQDFLEVWQKIRQPRYGKAGYILMIDQNARRVGGSKYSLKNELWVLDQGAVGEQIQIEQIPNIANTSSSSSAQQTVIKSDIDRFKERINETSF